MCKIKVNCETCNKELEKYQSQYNNSESKRFYCSKECRSKYRSSQIKKEKFICEYCNREFELTHREIKLRTRLGSNVRFCSKKCKMDNRAVERKIIKCDYCNEDIDKRITEIGKLNFCDKNCYKNYHNEYNFIEIKCKNCLKFFRQKEHYVKRQYERGQKVIFCSRECQLDFLRKGMVELECSVCKSLFRKKKSKINKSLDNFCSFKCKLEYFNSKRKKVKCDNCGKEKTINDYKYKSFKKHFCDNKCFHEYIANQKDTYEYLSHFLRTSSEYKEWREKIFNRDNFKCTKCGDDSKLHAHHIKTLHEICNTYNMDKDKIIKSIEFNDIDNGITLCPKCHNKEHPFIKRDEKGRFCRLETKLQKSQDD